MKKTILVLLAFFSTSVAAQGFYDYLSGEQKFLLNVQLRLGLNKQKSKKVTPEQLKKRCLEAIDYSVERWNKQKKEDNPFVDAYVLEDSFTKEEIEKSETTPSYEPWRNSDLHYTPGLANERKIHHSYSYLINVPHTRPACRDQWFVKEVQIITVNEKSCRRVKIELHDYEYGMTFCEGDKTARIDHMKDPETHIKCAGNS